MYTDYIDDYERSQELYKQVKSDCEFLEFGFPGFWDQFRGFPPPRFDYWVIELAIRDALNQEGVPAHSGDATSCVTQIVEAYARAYDAELKEQELREQHPSLKAAWDNYQMVRKLTVGEEKETYDPPKVK